VSFPRAAIVGNGFDNEIILGNSLNLVDTDLVSAAIMYIIFDVKLVSLKPEPTSTAVPPSLDSEK